MKRFRRTTHALLLATLLLALGFSRDTRAAATSSRASLETEPSSVGTQVLDPSAIDTTVNPCEDFYQYACGNWLERTTLPSDQGLWFRSFSTIYDANLTGIRSVLENYARGKFVPLTPNARKLGAFYASCMDDSSIEKQTATALKERLALVHALRSKKDLPTLLAKFHLQDVGAFFQTTVTADLKIPTLMTAQLEQGGMGLPERGSYLNTDDRSVRLRKLYLEHIEQMLELAGVAPTEAKTQADAAYAIELRLAKAALPPDQLQDSAANYHPTSLADLAKRAEALNWSSYFLMLGASSPKFVNVTEPEFLDEVNAILRDSDVETLRAYLNWQVVQAIAPSLGAKVFAESFRFNETVLNGKSAPGARWKTCVQATSSHMGEAVGQAFVKNAFSPKAKERVLSLIDKLRLAFERDFKSLDWLDAPTREAALEKLGLLTRKIGYPDAWRSYADLEVSKNSYWKNRLATAVFNNRFEYAKVGGRNDPDEWHMTPQTVNAYYDSNVNQINFPAGILQPPFFSESATDAENFGAIGMVIGHEMTHAFDTSGSQFDGHGAQRDWWSPAVKALFQSKAQCLIDQYGAYDAMPGLKVNGQLTVTENIADQGGLKLAFAAFKLASQGQVVAPIAGLTGDQQFYVSMAQLWCAKSSDESLSQQVATDPHSPSRFRVLGTVTNSPDFAEAFRCESGQPMAPAKRCPMW